MDSEYIYSDITDKIIGSAIEVHKTLGPGLLESIYESALCIELNERGLAYQQQYPIDVSYKGKDVGTFKVDLIVEELIVVELKSTAKHDPIFEAQILSYMKLGNYNVGLLINFNNIKLIDGIKRFVF